MALRLRTTTALTVVATAVLAPASAAAGAQRYAAPAGTGTACTQATPCDLDTAVEDPAVNDGDEVIVTPGSYATADLFVDNAIEVHGQAGQTVPTITLSGFSGVNAVGGSTVSDLRIEATNGPGISTTFAPGATFERLYVHHSLTAGVACSLFTSSTLRDSVCWSDGVNSAGAGGNTSFGPAATIRLRNVTAVGSSYGLDFGFNGGSNTVTVDGKNVIAQGGTSPGADVRASASGGPTTQIVLDHSNYATELEVGTTGGTASITDPGSGTNQTSEPAFAGAATGDFHQLPGSPTVDAGTLDGFTGTADFEGDPRSLDGDGACPVDAQPDIGADELTPEPDCDPPETTISGGPTGFTNDPSPTFTLLSDEPGSTFECRIDTDPFASCTSPHTTPVLANGPHTLEVRAIDPSPAQNVDPTPDTRTFTVDTDPPETTIAGGPSVTTNDSTPTFNLQSDEAGSSFECKIDNASFDSCTSPYTTPVLGDGSHTLEVRATDSALNVDSTPDSRAFTVDTAPPETTISGGPTGAISDRTPTFTFSANETNASLECKLDDDGYDTCGSPYTTAIQGDGQHTLSVRATDTAGNKDQTPAKRTFLVDGTAPQTTITAAPKARLKTRRRKAKVSLAFAANEPGRFECSLDGTAFSACASPQTAMVGKGSHVWRVRAIDRVGNADGSPAQASFKVKRKRKRR